MQKEADGTDLTLSTNENAVTKTLAKRFPVPLDFDYFTQPVSPYYLHEDLIVTIELNKSEKVMLCFDDNAATYTISDIALEYDGIIDAQYMENVSRQSQAKQFVPLHKGLQDYLINDCRKKIPLG